MSKKNNKKSIKKFNRNAYKIESLEPRVMMDADANEWIDEMQTVEQSFDSVDGSIVTNMDLDIEGLSRQPDKSLEYNRAPIKFNEVFNVVDEIKKSADYKNVQSFINTCIESCREDVCSSEIADVVSAQGKLDAVRQENPVDPSKIALAEQELHDAENVRDKALNEAKISANQLLAKLKTVSGNWSFAKNGADSILVSVTTTLGQKGSRKSDNVNPDIGTQTRLGVQFDDRYDRTAVYSWSFTIDGNKSTAMDLNIHSDMSLGFRQNLTDKEAELGVLKLTSKPDVDENDADYQVNASLDAGENVQTTFTPSYNVDLNFKLNNSNQLEKDLSLNAPSDMVLSGTSLASATWGSDDNLLRKIKYVQMGDVLNKLNDMCYELSTMARDDSRTLFDNSDLDSALDQKTKTLIDFSKMFDPILKIPPQSLQELMDRLGNKAEIVVENGDYILKIPFALSSSLSSKVSLNNKFLKKVIEGQTSGFFANKGFKFDVTEKNSLDYKNDSTLSFDMKLTLTDSSTPLVSDATTLKDYLDYDSADTDGNEKRLSLYGKSYVAQGNTLALNGKEITENIEIEISHAASTAKATVNKGTKYNSDIGQAIVNKLKTIDSNAKCFCSESIFAFVSKLTDVQMNVTGENARQVGIYGNRSFESSYLFELSAGAKVTVDSKQMDVPKDSTQFQKFSLQMQNQLGAGYKVVYVEDAVNPAILIQLVNDKLKFSNFSGGVVINSLILYRNQDDQTAFSIDPSLASFKFTIDLTNPVDDVIAKSSVSSFELSFDLSDFEKCLVIDDVANVINSKLARYQDQVSCKQAVFAEIIQDDSNKMSLVFRCDNQSIDVTASESVFGFDKGTTVSALSNSISLTVSGHDYEISLYDSLNEKLEDSKGNALTIRGLLEIIKQKMKAEHSVDLTIDGDGLSFVEVTEIKDLDAFTLVKSLGLHEYVTGSRPLEDVKTSVDLSNINLTMTNHIAQDNVVAHANMGMLGIDYSGKVDFTAKYENRAADWDEFVNGTKKAWSYTSNAANTIGVNLSQRIANASALCGTIEIVDATNSWSGRVTKSPLVNNLNSSFSSDIDMAMFATSLAEGLQKFLDNKIVGNAELKNILPLIGRSAPEVFGIQSKVTEFVSELKRNLPVTLQELSARLSASLGATLTFSVESDGIKASFDWTKNLNHEKIAISTLSLGNSGIFVGGNAEAYLDGSAGLTLNMKVGTAKGADEFLPVTFLDDSKVNFDVTLKGNPLKFDLSVSTASASVSLLKVVSTNDAPSYLNMKANMEMGFDKSSQSLKKIQKILGLAENCMSRRLVLVSVISI